MLYYDNEWKLSKYKIYYTDKDLNKNMENYVGVEGIEWWQNLDFITINRVEDLTYTEEELKRYAEIKNKSQSENSRQLECYIKNIEYIEEVEKEEQHELTNEEKTQIRLNALESTILELLGRDLDV